MPPKAKPSGSRSSRRVATRPGAANISPSPGDEASNNNNNSNNNDTDTGESSGPVTPQRSGLQTRRRLYTVLPMAPDTTPGGRSAPRSHSRNTPAGPHTPAGQTMPPPTPEQPGGGSGEEAPRLPVTDEVHVDSDEERDFHTRRPAYVAHTYARIQDRLRALTGVQLPGDGVAHAAVRPGLIRAFAERHFAFEDVYTDDDGELLAWLRGRDAMDVHTALLVGSVADGGPRGPQGWADVFREPLERQALVCGMVGLVLQEHVFGSLCFGATEEQLEELHEGIDAEYCNLPEDAFTRTARRQSVIRDIIADAMDVPDPSKRFPVPPDFFDACRLLAWQLYTVLTPILALSAAYIPPAELSSSSSSVPKQQQQQQKRRPREQPADLPAAALAALAAVLHDLHHMVVHAALTALHMRLDAHTVYHAAPAAKDEFWNEREMRAFNRAAMVAQNPYLSISAEHDSEETKRWKATRLALVRMPLFHGWTAVKRGGWRAGDKGRGVRVCELGRSWVSLRWGEQRRWPAAAAAAAAKEQGEEGGGKGKKGKKGKGEAKEEGDGPRWVEWLDLWSLGAPEERNEALKRIWEWFAFNTPRAEFESESESALEQEMVTENDV